MRSNAPGDQDAIDLEAFSPHPVELVWRALTEPAALATFDDPDGNGWVLSKAPQRR
jgi:uncharacterized protein YndB with AHSA1/START domain